jgi:hypothetical protein
MEYSKTFPEPREVKMQPEGVPPSYINSSEAVGCGHEDSMNRMAKFSNSEFPNEESGEGKGE